MNFRKLGKFSFPNKSPLNLWGVGRGSKDIMEVEEEPWQSSAPPLSLYLPISLDLPSYISLSPSFSLSTLSIYLSCYPIFLCHKQAMWNQPWNFFWNFSTWEYWDLEQTLKGNWSSWVLYKESWFVRNWIFYKVIGRIENSF